MILNAGIQYRCFHPDSDKKSFVQKSCCAKMIPWTFFKNISWKTLLNTKIHFVTLKALKNFGNEIPGTGKPALSKHSLSKLPRLFLQM